MDSCKYFRVSLRRMASLEMDAILSLMRWMLPGSLSCWLTSVRTTRMVSSMMMHRVKKVRR